MSDFTNSRAGQVIDRALARGRLAHALLLHGARPESQEAFARQLAARLLQLPSPWAAGVHGHADYFSLRPSGKSRQIRIGKGAEDPNSMRQFIRQLAQTPHSAPRKVGVVFEADRLNPNSANAFLKTLEEPPLDTTILLLTSRPYALLPTIRSRCLNFRLPSDDTRVEDPVVLAWLEDYRSWLRSLAAGGGEKTAPTRQVMTVYALVARFSRWIESATAAALAKLKQGGALENLDEDEVDALKSATSIGVRQHFLATVEAATCALARGLPECNLALARSVDELERVAGLLRVNFNENAALELYLLAALRAWSRRE